jgi:glycosyltransferase involved in cell wall biosynthesis
MPLDARWRAQAAGAQEAVLPSGRVVVSCSAPYGVGGLGRHLQEIVEALDRRGAQPVVICGSPSEEPAPRARRRSLVPELAAALAPLGRFSAAWRIWQASVSFDARAARTLPQADHLIGFNGTSIAQFAAARRQISGSVSLMSANSHFRRVVRQHALAQRQYPLERPWPARLVGRNLREYARADRIYVASNYVRESFLEEGFAEETISTFPLTPATRYRPQERLRDADTFDIVYVGSLTVHKGVPLLLDAVRRLRYPDLRVVLVGGWKTRGMRRFLQQACAEDKRIRIAPGDPLAHLLRARLCVHAAYEDGFGYAPAEALACGVPVIVSEDTGMKELIEPGRSGLILPTGDLSSLTEAIEAAYRRESMGD